MSTRRAKDDSVFHQNRYASSPEFERGLLGNLVVKRCALLDAAADRELIWFIQYLSHQPGGISRVAADLIKQNPDQIQTVQMAEMKLKPGQICNAERVEKIRAKLPVERQNDFLLKGETDRLDGPALARRSIEWENDNEVEFAAAQRQPESYNSNLFFELCRSEAESNLEEYLCELCLDPSTRIDRGAWFFHGLINVLKKYLADYTKSQAAAFTTALGQKVFEVLDYTAFSRGLTLMEGEARRGKSFAARVWCQQRPGKARFVEVPPGNDDVGFYRALARGLGMGNLLRYKACDVRDRVESVLLSGDLLLVLDEAQRLWPQCNLRYASPGRITWLMTMANAGVPIAMVSTPQFITTQKAVEKNGWNAAQLTGRIAHYEPLPAELSRKDLIGVAKAILPNATERVLEVLAAYADDSKRYLAAIEAISKRAHYLAAKAGRDSVSTDDIRTAMKQSVVPSDDNLRDALQATGKKRIKPNIERQAISDPAERQPALDRGRSVEAPLIET